MTFPNPISLIDFRIPKLQTLQDKKTNKKSIQIIFAVEYLSSSERYSFEWTNLIMIDIFEQLIHIFKIF